MIKRWTNYERVLSIMTDHDKSDLLFDGIHEALEAKGLRPKKDEVGFHDLLRSEFSTAKNEGCLFLPRSCDMPDACDSGASVSQFPAFETWFRYSSGKVPHELDKKLRVRFKFVEPEVGVGDPFEMILIVSSTLYSRTLEVNGLFIDQTESERQANSGRYPVWGSEDGLSKVVKGMNTHKRKVVNLLEESRLFSSARSLGWSYVTRHAPMEGAKLEDYALPPLAISFLTEVASSRDGVSFVYRSTPNDSLYSLGPLRAEWTEFKESRGIRERDIDALIAWRLIEGPTAYNRPLNAAGARSCANEATRGRDECLAVSITYKATPSALALLNLIPSGGPVKISEWIKSKKREAQAEELDSLTQGGDKVEKKIEEVAPGPSSDLKDIVVVERSREFLVDIVQGDRAKIEKSFERLRTAICNATGIDPLA